jgi:hypothetical protein
MCYIDCDLPKLNGEVQMKADSSVSAVSLTGAYRISLGFLTCSEPSLLGRMGGFDDRSLASGDHVSPFARSWGSRIMVAIVISRLL